MTDIKLLDSSVWVEYLFNNKYKEIIESNGILITSTLSLFEIKKKLQKEKSTIENIEKSIQFIKEHSLIISVNSDIAEQAAQLSFEQKIPAMDSLIYTTAQIRNAHLLTCDNDFRGLNNVTILN